MFLENLNIFLFYDINRQGFTKRMASKRNKAGPFGHVSTNFKLKIL